MNILNIKISSKNKIDLFSFPSLKKMRGIHHQSLRPCEAPPLPSTIARPIQFGFNLLILHAIKNQPMETINSYHTKMFCILCTIWTEVTFRDTGIGLHNPLLCLNPIGSSELLKFLSSRYENIFSRYKKVSFDQCHFQSPRKKCCFHTNKFESLLVALNT